MNSIYLIKVINRYSLIIGVLNLLFAIFKYNGNSGALFFWVTVMTFASYLIKNKSENKKFTYLLAAATFLFIFLSHGYIEMIFVICICAFAAYFIVTEDINSLLAYQKMYDDFVAGSVVSIIATVIAIILPGVNYMESFLGYYVILYFVSGIILLRTTRYLRYNPDDKKFKRINLIYCITIVITTIIVSISNIRDAVFKAISNGFNFIVDTFMYLFSWFFLGVGYVCYYIFTFIQMLASIIRGKLFQQQSEPQKENPIKHHLTRKSIFDVLVNNPFIHLLLKAFIIIIIIYVLYFIYKKRSADKKVENDYIESKETIEKDIRGKKGILAKVSDFLNRPKDSESLIRYYYSKFLSNIITLGVEVQSSDTTNEINSKASEIHSSKILRPMREIYIKIRYGSYPCDDKTKKEFITYYKDLKQEEKSRK